jgi:hypothetical protein
MVFVWPSSKIVSVDPDFQPRWPPIEKRENAILMLKYELILIYNKVAMDN